VDAIWDWDRIARKWTGEGYEADQITGRYLTLERGITHQLLGLFARDELHIVNREGCPGNGVEVCARILGNERSSIVYGIRGRFSWLRDGDREGHGTST
jgi:hypothetical protein